MAVSSLFHQRICQTCRKSCKIQTCIMKENPRVAKQLPKVTQNDCPNGAKSDENSFPEPPQKQCMQDTALQRRELTPTGSRKDPEMEPKSIKNISANVPPAQWGSKTSPGRPPWCFRGLPTQQKYTKIESKTDKIR